jgi:GntR family transcriptional regulator of arabinose operon
MQHDSAEKPVAKYLQIKHKLLQYFADEHYQADQRLPSENALMQQFGVSRNTIRQALGELVNDGVIYKKHRSGSFFSGTRSESQDRSYLIGVIAPNLSTYIYPQIIHGIDDVVQRHHSNIVLACTKGVVENEQSAIEQMLSRDIDGLIIEPAPGFSRIQENPTFQFIKTLSIPVVFSNCMIDDADVSYVSVNDLEGGFRATDYLAWAGHRRIACIYLEHDIAGRQRYQGYRKALEQWGISCDPRLAKPIPGSFWGPEHVNLAMRELLDLNHERPTAMFFFNDAMAIRSGYPAVRKAGLRIPDDVSIMGFDDSEIGALAEIPLTSVAHPKYAIGRWAAELLFEKIESGGTIYPKQLLMTPVITVRDSVRDTVI